MPIAEFVEGWNSILKRPMGKTETNKLSIKETGNNTSSMIRVFSKLSPSKQSRNNAEKKRVVTRPGAVISHVVVVIVLM